MNSIRCPQCNFLGFATATECKRCKYEFQTAQTGAVQFQPNNPEAENSGDLRTSHTSSQPNNYQPTTFGGNFQNPKSVSARTERRFSSQNQPKYQATSQKPKIKLAVISMILGIISFPFINMIIGIILSIILVNIFGVAGAVIGFLLPLTAIPGGLITGIVSLIRANKRPFEYGGKGFAITGIVISGISLLIIPIVVAIAIPNLLAARRAANEGSAIAGIRTIAKAENNYLSNKSGCAELNELAGSGAIDPVLASGTKSGYRFLLTKTPNGCEITVAPTVTDGVSATGIRSFYAASDENWIIRSSVIKGVPATKTDLAIESY